MVAGKWRSSWPSWALGLVSLAGLAALAWLAKRLLARRGPRSLGRSAIPFLEATPREAPREGPLRQEPREAQPREVPDHEAPAREEGPGESQASEGRVSREEVPREDERPAPVAEGSQAETLPATRSEGIAAPGAVDAVQAPDARPFQAASSSAGPAEQLLEASEAPAEQPKATAKPSQAAAKKAGKATGMARGFLNKPAKKQSKKVDSEATSPPTSASASTAPAPETQKEAKAGKATNAATAVATATATSAEDSTSATATRLLVSSLLGEASSDCVSCGVTRRSRARRWQWHRYHLPWRTATSTDMIGKGLCNSTREG